MKYPVHEVFHTFQGEGVYMGRPAFFIRLYGCPVQCPWCDSAGTWHPEWVPKDVIRYTSEELCEMVNALPVLPECVVITGGEPAMFDLRELTFNLKNLGVRVHLETSGAFEIKGTFDWVTVSPKKWKHPVLSSIQRADEFKFIIEEPDDIPFYDTLALPNDKGVVRWLHPEWSHREDPVVLGAISDAVKLAADFRFRAGWQIHKLYQVDYRDIRSRPPVPLGGNPTKGF